MLTLPAHTVTLYSEKACSGNVYFQKPGSCFDNIDDLPRWSYALTCVEE